MVGASEPLALWLAIGALQAHEASRGVVSLVFVSKPVKLIPW